MRFVKTSFCIKGWGREVNAKNGVLTLNVQILAVFSRRPDFCSYDVQETPNSLPIWELCRTYIKMFVSKFEILSSFAS